MSGLLDSLSVGAREELEKTSFPSWIPPMLATLTHDRFSDPGWLYERKLDGERCLVFRNRGSVRLLSRGRKALNNTYPELEMAFGDARPARFVADGEVVAFDGARTSFERLQGRMQIKDRKEAEASRIAVYYYLFDLLYLDGHDLTGLALTDRKSLLERALDFDNRIRYTAHRRNGGEAYYEEACENGWEGLIVKRASGPYRAGRSKDWLKFKCVNRQEFVIGGYTEPQGSRIGFGALLIGYHEDGRLRFAGKVGTGYDEETLERLHARLERLERKTPPFDAEDLPRKGVHWVTPELVGEVGFTEWTEEGKLRHPRFLGLRRDKQPGDVVREKAAE